MYEYRALTEEETDQYLNGTRVFPGARETEHGVEVPYDCECSEEYGPCEEHCEVLARREGASSRTADDLVYVFLTDVLAIAENRGLISADMRGRVNVDKLREAIDYWDNDDLWSDTMGCRWVRDDIDAEIHDDIVWGEQVAAELGLSVWWEDGYVISRVTGGPLVD